jgi:hypothetical protein
MPITDLTISNSDIVAGQKVFSSQALARIDEIEAWANDQVAAKAMDLDSAQTATAAKDFSGGDFCIVKTQSAGNDTTQAASTAFVKAALTASETDGFVPTSYAGEEVVVFPNGLILKTGVKSVGANTTAVVTFDVGQTAFSVLKTILLTIEFSSAGGGNAGTAFIKAKSATAFTILNSEDSTVTVHWQAWGR